MKEKFAVLEIDVELTAFEVWLIEHINQNHPALKLKAIHPTATPWELAKSGIDPWQFVKKFSIEFSVSAGLPEPVHLPIVYFDITPLEESGIQVTIATSAPVEKTYLDQLVNSIKKQWQKELIASFAASFHGIKKLESGFEQYTQALVIHVQNVLVERFDLEEFKDLCFRLSHSGVTFDGLRGEGLAGKARELVAYFQRRQQIQQLVEAIRQARPDIDL